MIHQVHTVSTADGDVPLASVVHCIDKEDVTVSV